MSSRSAIPNDYVAMDLETTGKDPYTAEIIEIGTVKIVNRRPAQRWSTLVKPSGPLPRSSPSSRALSTRCSPPPARSNRCFPSSSHGATATSRRSQIPKGKYKGTESIWASIEVEPIGWTSTLQADRHPWRINDGNPHYCLACITQGKKKLEISLILPGKNE